MLDSMEKEHQEKAKEWIGVVSSQTTTRTHQETSQDQFDYDFDILVKLFPHLWNNARA